MGRRSTHICLKNIAKGLTKELSESPALASEEIVSFNLHCKNIVSAPNKIVDDQFSFMRIPTLTQFISSLTPSSDAVMLNKHQLSDIPTAVNDMLSKLPELKYVDLSYNFISATESNQSAVVNLLEQLNEKQGALMIYCNPICSVESAAWIRSLADTRPDLYHRMIWVPESWLGGEHWAYLFYLDSEGEPSVLMRSQIQLLTLDWRTSRSTRSFTRIEIR